MQNAKINNNELMLQTEINGVNFIIWSECQDRKAHIFSVEQKNGTKDELMVALATESCGIQQTLKNTMLKYKRNYGLHGIDRSVHRVWFHSFEIVCQLFHSMKCVQEKNQRCELMWDLRNKNGVRRANKWLTHHITIVSLHVAMYFLVV